MVLYFSIFVGRILKFQKRKFESRLGVGPEPIFYIGYKHFNLLLMDLNID